MDEEKKKFKFKIPAVSFRLLLTIVFIVLGITPVFIYGRMVSRTNLSSRIDARKIELQTKGLMLSNKLTRGNFLKDPKERESLNSEIDAVAEIYNRYFQRYKYKYLQQEKVIYFADNAYI